MDDLHLLAALLASRGDLLDCWHRWHDLRGVLVRCSASESENTVELVCTAPQLPRIVRPPLRP